jgi:Do/DeqQ family serine protease
MQHRLRSYYAGVLAAGIIAGGSAVGWYQTGNPVHAVDVISSEASARTLGANQDSYADLVSKVSPAVVTDRSERVVHRTQQLPDDPLFRRFFDDRFGERPESRSPRQSGLGSGVIVRPDGYVLTNHHVVDGAEEVTVELADRRTFDAKVVGSDEPSDLAVLKIDATNLPTLPLGNSDEVRVGDVVLAVGNPLGVGQTVTMGIVSAKGRSTGLGEGAFEDFIQTDAPINQGNSGGALVNTRGELIGINSQILSPSGGNIGIGFAIPATMAREIMVQLIDGGSVRRGMLGVTIQPVTSEIARSLSMDTVQGALVNSVQANGPADKAGVEQGDVIVSLDGGSVSDGNSLRNHIARLKPGATVKLGVLRDGKEQTLTATLGELSARAEHDPAAGAPMNGNFGLSVEPLTAQSAKQRDLNVSEGLLVTAVDPAGAAADAGFRPGDVIQEVDGKPVSTVGVLKQSLNESGTRPALVLVNREGASLYLTLRSKPSAS